MNIQELTEMGRGTMIEAIGIELLEINKDYVSGRMPVDSRTIQPFGLLHGGASAAFAETLGSVAGMLKVDPKLYRVVGKSLNCKHIRSAKSGWVFGKAVAVEISESTHVWAVEIKDEKERLICSCRLTLAVIGV